MINFNNSKKVSSIIFFNKTLAALQTALVGVILSCVQPIMHTEDNYLVLKNHKVFQCLSEDEFDSLGWVHDYYEAKKGDFFYFGKETLENLYFLKSGKVKLGFKNEDNEIIIKDILQPGDIFGQLSLAAINAKKEFAQALDDEVSICLFSIKQFKEIINNQPQVAIAYTLQINKQNTIVENRLSNLILHSSKKRLTDFLMLLADKFGTEQSNHNIQISIAITHEEIAQMIASTRQTVTTILTKLSAANIINYSRKELIILNKKKLLSE